MDSRKGLTLEEISGLVHNLEAEQEWRRRQSRRHLKTGLLLFLGLMLMMTFVCRMIYTEQLPQVDWGYANRGSLNYSLSLDGVVGTESPKVVYGQKDLRIARLCVSAGDPVRKGTLLYEVDVEDLQQQLDELKAEHGTWWKRAQNWYEDARTETAWYESEVREAQIAFWQELIDGGGKVFAEESGMILEVLAQAGDRMDGTPVFRYSNESCELKFEAVVSADQKSLVHIGDSVSVKFAGSKKECEGAIDWLEEENGSYRAMVHLPKGEGQGEIEAAMTLKYTSQVYDYVIPIGALHKEEDRYCIYVLKEKEGILGTELSAKKLDVRLLEQSPDQAAVAEELLEDGMKIITDSSQELKDGVTVREAE